MVLGETGDGGRTVSRTKRSVEDDQTPDVPIIFSQWKNRGPDMQMIIWLATIQNLLNLKP